MESIFVQLAIILGLSSVFGFLAKIFHIPLLVAYLFVGLGLSATGAINVHNSEVLEFLPEIGIAFMLFLVGMELDLREIKNLGKPIFVAGVLQIVITTIIGATVAKFFGFGNLESWYLGVGLSFSATVLVVKLLLEKKDLVSLYGKLALGILLLEDLVAVVLMLILTSSPSIIDGGYSSIMPLLQFLGKVGLLFGVAIFLNRYFLSRLFSKVSDSGELLFLTALAWCFLYVSFAHFFGFSDIIGAFLAGVALASSPYHFQIQGKVKPLRDFFVALFFVYLGAQVDFSYLQQNLILVAIFTSYALLVKPIIFLLALGIFGFRKHTMFNTAVTLSQVSEFSLILMVVGFDKGDVTSAGLTVIALTAVLSFFVSSLMITNANRIYKLVSIFVSFFERKNFKHFLEKADQEDLEGHIIVIGGHRVGGAVVNMLRREKVPQVVLDFNPDQVQQLLSEHVPVIYGDMGDPEVLEALDLRKARMIISTAPDVADNKLLLEDIKNMRIDIPVIVRAETTHEADQLYKAGADYVVIPEILAGEFLVGKLKDHLNDHDYFKSKKKAEWEKLHKKSFAKE